MSGLDTVEAKMEAISADKPVLVKLGVIIALLGCAVTMTATVVKYTIAQDEANRRLTDAQESLAAQVDSRLSAIESSIATIANQSEDIRNLRAQVGTLTLAHENNVRDIGLIREELNAATQKRWTWEMETEATATLIDKINRGENPLAPIDIESIRAKKLIKPN